MPNNAPMSITSSRGGPIGLGSSRGGVSGRNAPLDSSR